MPQHLVEVEEIRAVFLDRLRGTVGDPGVGKEAELLRPDAMTVPRQRPCEVRDHVVDDVAIRVMDGGAEIAGRSALDRLLAAGERDPYRRMRALERTRPDGDILERPE